MVIYTNPRIEKIPYALAFGEVPMHAVWRKLHKVPHAVYSHSSIKKKQNAHRIREAVAAGVTKVQHNI